MEGILKIAPTLTRSGGRTLGDCQSHHLAVRSIF